MCNCKQHNWEEMEYTYIAEKSMKYIKFSVFRLMIWCLYRNDDKSSIAAAMITRLSIDV